MNDEDVDALLERFPVAAALRAEGASEERLAAFAGAVALNALRVCPFHVGEGSVDRDDPGAPGWALMETSPNGYMTRGLHALDDIRDVTPVSRDPRSRERAS